MPAQRRLSMKVQALPEISAGSLRIFVPILANRLAQPLSEHARTAPLGPISSPSCLGRVALPAFGTVLAGPVFILLPGHYPRAPSTHPGSLLRACADEPADYSVRRRQGFR